MKPLLKSFCKVKKILMRFGVGFLKSWIHHRKLQSLSVGFCERNWHLFSKKASKKITGPSKKCQKYPQGDFAQQFLTDMKNFVTKQDDLALSAKRTGPEQL